MSRNHQIYVATISAGCREAAMQYGLGLECDTFCTAVNLEDSEMIRQAEQQMEGISRRVLHAPFNELCPAAIEPEVVRITRMRYEQAWAMAQKLGIHRMVVHSGYIPLIYFPQWFPEKSVAFWKEFLQDKPENAEFLLENVLEGEPNMTASIVEAVDDPRLKLCLDIGHANSEVSDIPVETWVRRWAPRLGHVHIHNNEGGWDFHDHLDRGTIPMAETLKLLAELAPDATWTLETLEAAPSCHWLAEQGWIEE
ncbi:MAG: sugar phosphate isomerase/epimerase [Clostridia bacterium]|nr:sugar phosphate isomerase/epimerase [Clostridia bacterium]